MFQVTLGNPGSRKVCVLLFNVCLILFFVGYIHFKGLVAPDEANNSETVGRDLNTYYILNGTVKSVL